MPPAETEVPTEIVAARRCLAEATALAADDPVAALSWIRRVVDGGEDFAAWTGAAALLDTLAATAKEGAMRTARVGLVGSYTTTQLVGLLRLAAYRFGVWIEVYEAGFDQYRQEILDPTSGMYRFSPDLVVIATHDGAAELPDGADDAERAVAHEADRWRRLWAQIREVSGATVVQHGFVVRPDTVYGSLAAGKPELRSSMVSALNRALAGAAEPGVAFVDCDAVASRHGKDRWLDDRYWHLSKQAVSLGALPVLARHTAAVIAAQLGLTRKALVLDLDGTLWGGVIGDDELAGLTLGAGSPAGEAYVAFQRYCKALAGRGVILAVCSKNDDATARLPFTQLPDMVLTEDDIAVFVANWEPKPENLRHIAETLNIGLDSLVFVDDNPAEREIVRRLLPMVEVVAIPTDPSGYIDAVAGTLLFEAAHLTDEDRARTEGYRALAAAAVLRESAPSMETFHRDLAMTADVAPFDEVNLPRVTQLIGKTNQFNLTTRRHPDEAVRRFMTDPGTVTLAIRLTDRLADHGLVAVVIAVEDGDTLDIDTWAMSCRVIGRTLERTVIAHLVDEARRRGLATIRGTYLPTARNALVAGLYEDLGFECTHQDGEATTWKLGVPNETPRNEFIEEPAWVK